jgi:hypothetical protein
MIEGSRLDLEGRNSIAGDGLVPEGDFCGTLRTFVQI